MWYNVNDKLNIIQTKASYFLADNLYNHYSILQYKIIGSFNVYESIEDYKLNYIF